jgi:hypothetical protein
MYETPFHSKPLTEFSFLITGGAGFIGSHLAEYLLKHRAKKVRVLDNLLTGKEENIQLFDSHPAYEFLQGDIREVEVCRKACDKIDFVLHQAALASVQRSMQDPLTTHVINADGFLNLIVAARDAGVKRFVYASSSSVYGDHPDLPKHEDKTGNPLSPYAVSKKTNELYAHVFATAFGIRDAERDWLDWMKRKHIPDIMKTGQFTNSRISKLLDQPEDDDNTYVIQYECENREKFDNYSENFASPLRDEFNSRYKDKFILFRTLMETV